MGTQGVAQGQSQGKWRWIALLVLVAMVAVNEFALAPKIAELKAAMGPIDALPKDDPQRATFGMWHGISAILHLLASMAAAWLVALGPATSSQGAASQGEACKAS